MRIVWLLWFCLALHAAPPQVQGITVVDARPQISSIPRNKGIYFQVRGVDDCGICSVLERYLGRQINYECLQDVKNALIDFLNLQNVFATVIMAEQEVSDGILIVEILQSRIGDIAFTGQKWFGKSTLASGISLKPGKNLDQNKALNELAALNRNPSRQTTLYLSPGDRPGMTDLEFSTQDVFPAHFYIGGDSTGVLFAERIRFFVGGRWDNAFQRGDTLGYQYITSPDFSSYQSHALTYGANLSSRNLLTFLGVYGTINADIPEYLSTGKSLLFSLINSRFIEPMYRPNKSHWDYGLVFKYFNSNLVSVGTLVEFPVILQNANVVELQFSYLFSNHWKSHEINLQLNAFISPFSGLIPHHNNAVYAVLRPGAHAQFAYFNGTFVYRYSKDSGLGCLFTIVGQAATGPLLVTEQLMMGGLTSIRGYEQAQFLADQGLYGQFEFYSPSFKIARGAKRLPDKAYFVAFFDSGYGFNITTLYPDTSQYMSGAGPGFRYEIGEYFTLRADYGFCLRQIPGASSTGRFYLSAMASY